MPTIISLLPIIPLLLLRGTTAQQPGSFTFNTSSTSSSCILISQLTLSDASSPPVLQAIAPLCTSSTRFPTLPPTPGDNSLTWPLSQDGTAAASGIAIYADITEQGADDGEGGGAKAGCVMQLSVDQVQYLLGRSLTWNAGEKELWDNTDSGFVMNGTTGGALVCNEESTLLPHSLVFPNPFKTNATDSIWWTALTVGDVAAGTAVAEADSEPAATSAGAEAVATGESTADASSTADSSAATYAANATGTGSATDSTTESTAVASTTSAEAEATSATDATDTAAPGEATSTGGEVVAVATGTGEVSESASATRSESASTSASDSASSAAATETSGSGTPVDDPIGVDSASGTASSDDAVSTTSSTASIASTSTDSSSSDAAATITTAPSTAGSATVAAVATSALGGSGQCVPVTITKVQTVTAGGGERRWWMGREYD